MVSHFDIKVPLNKSSIIISKVGPTNRVFVKKILLSKLNPHFPAKAHCLQRRTVLIGKWPLKPLSSNKTGADNGSRRTARLFFEADKAMTKEIPSMTVIPGKRGVTDPITKASAERGDPTSGLT